MKFNILILLLVVVLASCSKDPSDCFRSTGTIITETRALDDFSNILISDNIDVELISTSGSPKAEITGGENLMPGIITLVKENRLEIANQNSCNWARSFNKPLKIKLHYKRIDSIEYRSVGNVTCLDTLKTDTLWLSINEGGGSLSLLIKTSKSFINHQFGTADVHLYGFSQVNYIYQASYGPVIADSLTTNFNYLENRGTNHCWVNAALQLGVTISGPGNVYYRGNPEISYIRNGSGNLIKLD
ncbi:MAG: DUF2807 domain-containing protein [Bacteroidales bacterium]|nr:DUF2807 domain-containing protein [Bacteroidales bacterium]